MKVQLFIFIGLLALVFCIFIFRIINSVKDYYNGKRFSQEEYDHIVKQGQFLKDRASDPIYIELKNKDDF
jgi:hypothetical protein